MVGWIGVILLNGISTGVGGSTDDSGECGHHDGELLLTGKYAETRLRTVVLVAAWRRLSGGVGSGGGGAGLLHLAAAKRRIGGVLAFPVFYCVAE